MTYQAQILSLLTAGPMSLHDIVQALWPVLDEKPRETALCAVYYTRHCVDKLMAETASLPAEMES
jgi:hypothetical protein